MKTKKQCKKCIKAVLASTCAPLLLAHAAWGSSYDTLIFGAANDYCSQIESGNTNKALAFEAALRENAKLFDNLARNNYEKYKRRVKEEIAKQCGEDPPELKTSTTTKGINTPPPECPEISARKIRQIAQGVQTLIAGKSCFMLFN